MKRTLRLRKDELADLAPDELEAVAGGTVTYGCTYRPTLNTICLRELLSLEECG